MNESMNEEASTARKLDELYQKYRNANSFEEVKRLTLANANVLGLADEGGHTILHRVCSAEMSNCMSCVDIVTMILDQAPSVAGIVTPDWDTPLHCACINGASVKVIKKLIQAFPAATGMSNKKGYLPLHSACSTVLSVDALRALNDKYPVANMLKDNNGNFPLDVTLETDASDEVKFFLKAAFYDCLVAVNHAANGMDLPNPVTVDNYRCHKLQSMLQLHENQLLVNALAMPYVQTKVEAARVNTSFDMDFKMEGEGVDGQENKSTSFLTHDLQMTLQEKEQEISDYTQHIVSLTENVIPNLEEQLTTLQKEMQTKACYIMNLEQRVRGEQLKNETQQHDNNKALRMITDLKKTIEQLRNETASGKYMIALSCLSWTGSNIRTLSF